VQRPRIDLYLHLPVEQFELGDWRSLDTIVDIGYQSAREKIARWAATHTSSLGVDSLTS
jgi:hypothetical protein